MPSAEDDGLDAELERRLRRELDAIPPRIARARYLDARRPIIWRLAPAALAAALVGVLAISGYAETGSTNPAVWRDRAVNLIRPANPGPASQENENLSQTTPVPTHESQSHPSPLPSQRAEPNESPNARESPDPQNSSQPADDHSGSGSGPVGSSQPSPTPSDH